MTNDKNTTTVRGIGVTGLALLWGLITQALVWAGVIDWPWYAVWGPVLIALGLSLIVLFIALVVALIAVAADN